MIKKVKCLYCRVVSDWKDDIRVPERDSDFQFFWNCPNCHDLNRTMSNEKVKFE